MITILIHNSEFIIHNYDYFCLLYLLLQTTCLLVNLSTRQLNIHLLLCLLRKQLVNSFTRSLVYSIYLSTSEQTKIMKKIQNKKRLLCKYLIMGIVNGINKGSKR